MLTVGHFLVPTAGTVSKRVRPDTSDGTIAFANSVDTADVREAFYRFAVRSKGGTEDTNLLNSIEVSLNREKEQQIVSVSFVKGALSRGKTPTVALDGSALRYVEVPFPAQVYIESLGLLVTVFLERTPLDKTTDQKPDSNCRILLVGAGGIGCEVLKLLVLEGYRDIHILDLDTIDATNLNRQFLFTVESVGRPKSLVSREVVLSWFSADHTPPSITAYHDNIKAAHFDEAFFSSFVVVINALDNVSARQHVNYMCMRSGIPLIESGTMGYNGQTYPIIKGETECYHCQPKPPDKQTFAVCTIHARPTTMVHCVHYAKELYEALFGESSLQDGSSSEFAQIKGYLSSSTPNGAKDDQSLAERCQQVLVSLFVKKIMELLEMKSAWPSSPPVPLEEARIRSLKAVGNEETERWLADHETTSFTTDENIQLCLCAMMTLMKRDPAPFRKEDTQSVLFVSCIANLRAEVFHLTNQPFEEIRSIAGSIVPAIATTNAMVAAGVVHELESVLRRNIDLASPRDWKTIYVRKTPQVRKRKGSNAATPFHSSAGLNLRRINELYLIHTAPTATPNASCRVCQSVVPTVTVCLGTPYHTITLGDFARSFVEEKLNLESPSMSRKNAIVFETEDYEELEGELLSKIMEGDTTEKEFLVSGVNREAEWIVKVEFSDRDGFEIKGLEEAEETEARASGLQQNLTPRTTEPPTTEVVVIEDGETKEDDVIEID